MAGTSNSVTLTFTSNTASLDKGFRDVQQGAASTAHSLDQASAHAQELTRNLEQTGRAARGARELMSGAGNAASLMGGQMGGAVTNASLAALALKDLAKGAAATRLAMEGATIAVAGIEVGVGVALGVVAAFGVVLVEAWRHSEKFRTGVSQAFADVTLAVTKDIGYLIDGVELLLKAMNHIPGVHLDGVISDLEAIKAQLNKSAVGAQHLADKWDGVTAAAQRAAKAQSDAAIAASGMFGKNYDPSDPDGAFASQAALTPGTNAYNLAFGLGDYGDAAPIEKAASKSAKAVSAGLDKVKQAAQDKLSNWQSVLDSARSVSAQIASALAPKLDATFNSNNALLSQRKGGVIAGLQDQLAKMNELSRDVDKLAKAGLPDDLLQQIISAGPDGLPAARELLQGNNVATAKSLDKQINKTANHIAVGEATRQFNATPATVKVSFDVNGTDADLKKWIRKAIRLEGGGNVQLALGSK